MYIILMTNLRISQLHSSLGQDVFSSNNVWLIRTCDFRSGLLYFPIDSQVFCFRELNDNVLVDEIYDIEPAMDQVVKEYGSWNESRTNRLLLNDLSLYERRSDLMGYKFQAGTMPEAPYVTIAYDDENSISLGGLWGDIWHGMLGKMMNFSTKIVLSPDR